MKIYVGCPLTGMPEPFVKMVKLFQCLLEVGGVKVLRWNIAQEGKWSPCQTYLHDKRCVRDCNLLVAVHHQASSGLGIEMGMALAWEKPILILLPFGAETRTTAMVLGIPSNESRVEIRTYQDLLSEGPGLVATFQQKYFDLDSLPLFDKICYPLHAVA